MLMLCVCRSTCVCSTSYTREGEGGTCHALFDHGQLIPLVQCGEKGSIMGSGAPTPYPFPAPNPLPYVPQYLQDTWAPVLPRAHHWQFRLLSTCGDLHYMGLDAMQLFNEDGVDIGGALAPHQVHAKPSDVNILPEHNGDPRTVDKLFAPLTFGADASSEEGPWAPPPQKRKAPGDVWLAPWSPKDVNALWLSFEMPVGLSLIRLLNYSKDTARGVQEFEILADGLLVYRGWLRRGESSGPLDWQSIVLCDHPEVLQQERESGRLCGVHAKDGSREGSPQDQTLLIDEGKVMNKGITQAPDVPPPSNAQQRPSTACPPGFGRAVQ